MVLSRVPIPAAPLPGWVWRCSYCLIVNASRQLCTGCGAPKPCDPPVRVPQPMRELK